ncbi:hypothetical protein FF1_018443 [Malus domestica]
MMRIEELPQCSRSPTPGLELLQPEKGKKRWKMIEMIFLHPFQVSIIAAHQFAQTSSLSFVICRLLQKHALFKSATTTEVQDATAALHHFPKSSLTLACSKSDAALPSLNQKILRRKKKKKVVEYQKLFAL